jgi:alpha-ribazole phosphatase/probable phosphoglycerate mutase
MLPRPTSFVIVRHGHTDANGGLAGMRMSGWTDTPLSREGEREALEVAARLREEPAFAALYASPLQRALRTAAPISESVGLAVQLEPGLREIHCGTVDGRSVEEVRARNAEAWSRNAEERFEHFRWPGGESYREFRARCLRTLRRLSRRHPGERVLLVTHAGFISQVFGWVHGLSCARWSAYRPANASISALEWDGGLACVLGFDQRDHLAASPGAPATSPPPAG